MRVLRLQPDSKPTLGPDLQDQRVGQPEDHRAAARQPAGATLRHERREAGQAAAQQQDGETTGTHCKTPVASQRADLFTCVCVCVCVLAGPQEDGVLHGLERGEPVVQPVHLRLRPPGHRLEHQHPRPAAGEVIPPPASEAPPTTFGTSNTCPPPCGLVSCFCLVWERRSVVDPSTHAEHICLLAT